MFSPVKGTSIFRLQNSMKTWLLIKNYQKEELSPGKIMEGTSWWVHKSLKESTTWEWTARESLRSKCPTWWTTTTWTTKKKFLTIWSTFPLQLFLSFWQEKRLLSVLNPSCRRTSKTVQSKITQLSIVSTSPPARKESKNTPTAD